MERKGSEEWRSGGVEEWRRGKEVRSGGVKGRV